MTSMASHRSSAAPAPDEHPPPTGREALRASLWPLRASRGQVLVAVLLFALGLGLAIQVRAASTEDNVLRGARTEDLVRILSDLEDRTARLEDEKAGLEDQRTDLETSSHQAREARRQTEERARQLGVLAGMVAAEGPGVRLRIRDTLGTVTATMLLDAVQELRAAGAEAIQVNDVRIVADTAFVDGFVAGGGGVLIDGRQVTAPYVVQAIGRPQDLEPALHIPGGVVQSLEKEQAGVTVTRQGQLTVDATRVTGTPAPPRPGVRDRDGRR